MNRNFLVDRESRACSKFYRLEVLETPLSNRYVNFKQYGVSNNMYVEAKWIIVIMAIISTVGT